MHAEGGCSRDASSRVRSRRASGVGQKTAGMIRTAHPLSTLTNLERCISQRLIHSTGLRSIGSRPKKNTSTQPSHLYQTQLFAPGVSSEQRQTQEPKQTTSDIRVPIVESWCCVCASPAEGRQKDGSPLAPYVARLRIVYQISSCEFLQSRRRTQRGKLLLCSFYALRSQSPLAGIFVRRGTV